MKIRVETSGGFAGIPTTNEIDIDKLPNSLKDKVRELDSKNYLPKSKPFSGHKRSADSLNYKITITNGNKEYVIESNELDMDKSMKSILNYVRKNSKGTVDRGQ